MSQGKQARQAVEQAVFQHGNLTKKGLLERAFALAFRGLVYAQIWEDPLIDMEALEIGSDCHIVTIASGGCNVLSYLTADPRAITAVDLNTAHVALAKLKLAAARHLPDHAHFHRFFAQAGQRDNLSAYRDYVRPHLDDVSRRYWEARDLVGKRRISAFAGNIYKRGLLGQFIGSAHLLARLYKVDPAEILSAKSLEEQRTIFETRLAPIFDKKFVRWLTEQPASLFGLGIPPAQYESLSGDDPKGIAKVLRNRLEKLACDFDVRQNYFAWQAFGRSYADAPRASLPPYLEERHHSAMVERVERVDVRHQNFAEYLSQCPVQSVDRFILLDAQDWMSDAQLTHLWTEITRTARTGARVIFRTAAAPSILPGRIPENILNRWHYEAERSANYTRRDRSSIYGGFHLYVLKHA